MVAAWLTGSVVAPIPAVLSASGDLGGRAWGAKLRDPRGEVKAPPASAEALVSALRPELESARWYQGKGRELASAPARRPRSTSRTPTGASSRSSAAEYADGSAAEYAIPATRRGRTGARRSRPTHRPALDRARAAGGERRLGRGRARHPSWACRRAGPSETSTGATAGRSRQTSRTPRSSSTAASCSSSTGGCGRGRHPEQELLAGLTRVGSQRAPALAGVDRATGATEPSRRSPPPTPTSTGSPVGWEPAIAELAAALGGPAAELDRLAAETAELGRCAGELHRDLLTAFGGRARDEIRGGGRARARHRRARRGDRGDAAARARARRARSRGTRRARRRSTRLEGTQLQRIHGDLHVGQLLRTPTGVVAIDFEGDPTLPTEARRRPRLAAPGPREPAALARPCRRGGRPSPRLWRGDGRGVRVECARPAPRCSPATTPRRRRDARSTRAPAAAARGREGVARGRLRCPGAPRVALCPAPRAAEAARVNPDLFLADVLSAPERLARHARRLRRPPTVRSSSSRRTPYRSRRLHRHGQLALRRADRLGPAPQPRASPAWAEYASSPTPSPPSQRHARRGISASGDDARDRRRARAPRGHVDDGRRHERAGERDRRPGGHRAAAPLRA